MDYGTFGSYFDGAAAKSLSVVDVDPSVSNQHELGGVGRLRAILGDDDIRGIDATFAYLDDDSDPTFDHALMTWYDTRRNNPNRGPEYRLYYSDNAAVRLAHPGDLMVIATVGAREILVVLAKAGTTAESQIRWLFGLGDANGERFSISPAENERIGSTAARILELLGIEVGIPTLAEDYLDAMVERFGHRFPKGADFSAYSTSTLGELDWARDPDGSLLACYEREEMLFRVFERHLLERDLAPFLTTGELDVDGVLRVTMSTFQRRKSRAGTAFENQLSALFDARGIDYTAQAYTEGKSKPDFVFPSIEDYRDPSFPVARLTVLGAKTTIKERWRQVLDEADRVPHKHLVTLEPAVSTEYTDAMAERDLQLVVPEPVQATYTDAQRGWLMSVGEFCELVEERQTIAK